MRKVIIPHAVDEVRNRIAFLIPQVHSGKTLQWHISNGALVGLHMGKLLHGCLGFIGLEGDFAANPICTLFRNRPLGKLVAQVDFKF